MLRGRLSDIPQATELMDELTELYDDITGEHIEDVAAACVGPESGGAASGGTPVSATRVAPAISAAMRPSEVSGVAQPAPARTPVAPAAHVGDQHSAAQQLSGATAPQMVAAAAAEAEDAKKQGKTIHTYCSNLKARRIAKGDPTPTFCTKPDIETVADKWKEYADGWAGDPPLRDLERKWKAKWRCYEQGYANWSDHIKLYTAIEESIAAGAQLDVVIRQLQAKLDSISPGDVASNRGRKRKRVNWRGFWKLLAKEAR